MNGIDEFLEVALAVFLGIPVLLFLLTYLERSLIESAKEESPTVPDRVEEAPLGTGRGFTGVAEDDESLL